LETHAKEVAAAHPEPHTLCFISTDKKVVSTFEMATGKWTHFDPPRDRAELPAELPSRNPNIAHRFGQTGSALPNQR
jgi:hypothetical protein